MNTPYIIASAFSAASTTLAGTMLDANTNVPLGAVIAVLGVVVPASLWLGRKFKENEASFVAINKTLEQQNRTLAEIQTRLGTLPCDHQSACPPDNRRHK